MEKKKLNKPIIAVSLSLAFVLIFVVILFALGQKDSNKSSILLPEPQIEGADSSMELTVSENELLQIDKDNVIMALQSIEAPKYYRQTYTVEVGNGTNVSKTKVELWINDALKCGHITSDYMTKFVVTNGVDVWIWYANELYPVKTSLQDDVSFEDLLGLPGFQYLDTLEKSNILSSEYLIIGDGADQVSCVFLDTQEENGTTNRFWINLENGLIYRSDAVELDDPVYRVEQISFDLLVSEDEAFSDIFVLPDGTRVTTEGR